MCNTLPSSSCVTPYPRPTRADLTKGRDNRPWFDNAARFLIWTLIKQQMKWNFQRYVNQITQNVIALLNIWKILNKDQSYRSNWKIAPRCRITFGVSWPSAVRESVRTTPATHAFLTISYVRKGSNEFEWKGNSKVVTRLVSLSIL
jgi:glutathione peroxidase-family protein